MQITDRYRGRSPRRFSGFGETTTSQEDAAAQSLASLDAALAQAYVAVLPTISTWDAENVKSAVVKNLETDGARIERLRGELLAQVRAGSLAWEKWVGIAETTYKDIAYQMGLTSEWSMSGVLRSAVAATGEQIGDKVINGPPTWMFVTGFAVLGVLALKYLSPLFGLVRDERKRKLSRYREYEPEDRLDGYRRIRRVRS